MYLTIAKNKRNTVIAVALFMLLWAVFGAIIAAIFSVRFNSSTAPVTPVCHRIADGTLKCTTPSTPAFSTDFWVDWSTFTMAILTVVGIAFIYLLWTFARADKSVLRQSRALLTDRTSHPRLYSIVENLSTVAGIPTPEIYVIEDAAPNAFATGKNPKNSAVAVTTGIMEMMDDRELEAVLSHEISHIKNYDIRVNTVVYGLTMLMGIIVAIAFRVWLFSPRSRSSSKDNSGAVILVIALVITVVGVVMNLFMKLISLVVSRQREYLADATGAEIIHDVDALASALDKLRLNTQEVSKYNVAAAHLFFADPDTGDTPAKIGKPGLMAKFHNLFNTHPPLELRIARLRGFGDIKQGLLKS